MLTEERFKIILDKIEEKKVVNVSELMELLDTSESTIRRDLNSLDHMGKLKKVHGGATVIEDYNTEDEEIKIREKINVEDKDIIAKYAASIISKNDFVYIDAGTTTDLMIDYITEKRASYVTNSFGHGKKLAQKGFKVYILGGEFKISTEAIVGIEAVQGLIKYNFTKGFFGTNGISRRTGFSTPDIQEAKVKEEAIKRSGKAYILADNSKFNKTSPITFAQIDEAIIITTKLNDDEMKKYTEIVEVIKNDLHSNI